MQQTPIRTHGALGLLLALAATATLAQAQQPAPVYYYPPYHPHYYWPW